MELRFSARLIAHGVQAVCQYSLFIYFPGEETRDHGGEKDPGLFVLNQKLHSVGHIFSFLFLIV
jgi:hypothetical protein